MNADDKEAKYLGKWQAISGDQTLTWEFKKDGEIDTYMDNKKQSDSGAQCGVNKDGTAFMTPPFGESFSVKVNSAGDLIVTPPDIHNDHDRCFKRILTGEMS